MDNSKRKGIIMNNRMQPMNKLCIELKLLYNQQ